MKNTAKIQVNRKDELVIDDIYKEKKIRTQKFYSLMAKRLPADSKKLDRITNCGGFLQFKANQDFSKKSLYKANFCKERGCAYCDWRKSIADAKMITAIVGGIVQDKGYEFLFGTLSSVNCKGDVLSKEIDKYNDAFKKMLKRKEIKRINKGVLRKLEVTYNRKEDTYNLHIHFLMAVTKSYFKSRDYLKISKWLNIWQSVMNDETITNIYIAKAKSESGSNVFLELAKYSAKSTDLLDNKLSVFNTLMDSLHGRQLITYNLIFKEYKKKYVEGQLDNFILKDETIYVWLINSFWDFKKQAYVSDYMLYDFNAEEEGMKTSKRMSPFLSAKPR